MIDVVSIPWQEILSNGSIHDTDLKRQNPNEDFAAHCDPGQLLQLPLAELDAPDRYWPLPHMLCALQLPDR